MSEVIINTPPEATDAPVVPEGAPANPFLPTSQEVTVGGETLTVSEFNTGQVFAVLAQLADITKAIVANGGTADIVTLLAGSPVAIMTVIALAAGKDVAWVSALRPIDTIKIATAVVTVNAGFFAQAAALIAQAKAVAKA